MLNLQFSFLKKSLKVLPNSENDEKIQKLLERNLNINSLFVILKLLLLVKKRKQVKRYHSISRHFSFFQKPHEPHVPEINGKKMLEKRLTSIGCELIEIVGDGNCLFRSISCNLFKKQKYHMYVRKRCVEHMKNCHEEYSVYFENKEFEKYLNDMSKNGHWGDELCIKATADAFECVVYIITSTAENWCLKYESKCKKAKLKSVFLAYLSPIHYNCFKLIDK